MESATVPSQVIFIEYCQSNIPTCLSPISTTGEARQQIVRAPKGLLTGVMKKDTQYTVFYWTEEFIKHYYSKVSIENFKRSTKLSLLKTLNLTKGRLVIFTTKNVIETVLPRLQDDLPRRISCTTYFAKGVIDPTDLICYLTLPPFQEGNENAAPPTITTRSLFTETAFYS